MRVAPPSVSRGSSSRVVTGMNSVTSRTGLPASRPRTSHRSASNHLMPLAVAFARYPSAPRAFRCRGFGLRPSLADSPTAPGRIEFKPLGFADQQSSSRCSPPYLMVEQLRSDAGRRASARRGLAPLCSGALAGALAQASSLPNRQVGPPAPVQAGSLRYIYGAAPQGTTRETCGPPNRTWRLRRAPAGRRPSDPTDLSVA